MDGIREKSSADSESALVNLLVGVVVWSVMGFSAVSFLTWWDHPELTGMQVFQRVLAEIAGWF